MFIPPPPHYRGRPSDYSPAINDCWYGRGNLIFKMRVRSNFALIQVVSWNASVRSLRLCSITVQHKPGLGGEALLRLEPSSFTFRSQTLSSMLFPCHISWGNCLLFQLETPEPFPEACMDARMRATLWVCATVKAILALAAPCSTSAPGP